MWRTLYISLYMYICIYHILLHIVDHFPTESRNHWISTFFCLSTPGYHPKKNREVFDRPVDFGGYQYFQTIPCVICITITSMGYPIWTCYKILLWELVCLVFLCMSRRGQFWDYYNKLQWKLATWGTQKSSENCLFASSGSAQRCCFTGFKCLVVVHGFCANQVFPEVYNIF